MNCVDAFLMAIPSLSWGAIMALKKTKQNTELTYFFYKMHNIIMHNKNKFV